MTDETIEEYMESYKYNNPYDSSFMKETVIDGRKFMFLGRDNKVVGAAVDYDEDIHIYVRPKYRGRGLGIILLKNCLSSVLELGKYMYYEAVTEEGLGLINKLKSMSHSFTVLDIKPNVYMIVRDHRFK